MEEDFTRFQYQTTNNFINFLLQCGAEYTDSYWYLLETNAFCPTEKSMKEEFENLCEKGLLKRVA